ncbi:MAG: ABC transporter permease, partial [Clostridia bacterium]|nr:ABC transporter permease [Clostridia bacterium]
DSLEAVVDIDAIGAEANDAIINKYLSTGYRGDDYIEERGIYFNGYIDPVNMLEGRFFTAEETADKKNKTAVVGKEIYNKYVTFDEEGKAYYYSEDLDTNLEVIGVMGKEDRETALDFLVITSLKFANDNLGPIGSYTLDAKDKMAAEKLKEVFIEHTALTANVSSYKYTPRITVEAPTDILLMLLIIIIINAIVFCFYYVSKQGHIHGVKKIIGYSKLMILTDTFFDFLLLTLGAFVTGNALVILLKETVFKEVQLFSIYMLDPQVIVFSLSAVILLTVFLSVIAIAKTFTSGNTNEYRG